MASENTSVFSNLRQVVTQRVTSSRDSVPQHPTSSSPRADGAVPSAINEYVPESLSHHRSKSAAMIKTEFDRKILRWSSYLDVLLVFAALFSAIVTAFVIYGSCDLREDFGKTAADFFRATVNNDTLSVSRSHFRAPAITIWVNALWYSSLSFSLLTALGAMWGKLWIQECAILANEILSPSPDVDVALQKAEEGLSQVAINAEESWMKSGIHGRDASVVGEALTAILPVLMHFAILLFMLGLVVFVWRDSTVLSCLLLVFLAVGVIAYIVFARIRGVIWYQFLFIPWTLYRISARSSDTIR